MSNIDRNAPGAVFVGNISYDTTADQLRTLMQEVGPIKAIKLVLNRETGQHRGYGFVEYHSHAVAKSAMQNLAGRDLMGRKIRVDSASQNSKDHSGGKNGKQNNKQQQQSSGGEFSGGGDFNASHHRQQPHQIQAGPSQHEAVRNALQQLSVYQIYDVLKLMKELCEKKPQIAETILLSRPPLAQALLQAQHMFGMVHETVDGLELPTTTASNPSARSSSSQRVPLQSQSEMRKQQKTGGHASNSFAGSVVPPGHPPLLSAIPSSLPPPSMPAHSMPSQPAPPQQIAPPGTRIIQGFDNPVPENLVQQALGLTPDQIAGLQPHQRQQISMIRNAVQQQQQQQYAPPGGYSSNYR